MKAGLKKHVSALKSAGAGWISSEPLRESSVIAFYSVFSIPALLLLVINVATLVYEKEKIRSVVSSQIENIISKRAAEQILSAVDSASDFENGVLSTVAGIAIILFGAVRIFLHLRKSFDEIWQVDQSDVSFVRGLIRILFSVGIVLSLGFLLLVSMVVTTMIGAASEWLRQFLPEFILVVFFVIEFFISLGLISILFALMFRFLPDHRAAWNAVLPGGLITGIIFMLLKSLLSFVFTKISPADKYGAAGYIVLVLIWMSAVAMALFFGVRYVREYEKLKMKQTNGEYA